jgi:hypothetical protein
VSENYTSSSPRIKPSVLTPRKRDHLEELAFPKQVKKFVFKGDFYGNMGWKRFITPTKFTKNSQWALT